MGDCLSLQKLASDPLLIQQLTQSPFYCLDDNDEKSALHALSTRFVRVQYSAGHTLWKTGDTNITFNMIIDGEVRLEFHQDGDPVIVDKTVGQCFGGDALHWSDDADPVDSPDTANTNTTATSTATSTATANVIATTNTTATGVLYDCVALTDLTVYQLSYSALQSFWASHRPWHDMFSGTEIIPISRYLCSLNVFSSMTPHNASLLASMFRWKKIAKHDILFNEGTPGEEFYIVARGCVAVVVKVAKTETKYQLQLNDNQQHSENNHNEHDEEPQPIRKQLTNFVVGGGTGQISMLDPSKLNRIDTTDEQSSKDGDADNGENGEKCENAAAAGSAGADDDEVDTRVVYEFKSGDYFGEVSLVINIPRTATIQAMADTTLLELRKSDFERFVPRNNAIKMSLEQVAHERIAQSFRRYKIPLFNAVPLDQYHILSKLSQIKYYAAGQVVVDPTSTEQALFVIAHGNVGVYVTKQRVNVANVENVENDSAALTGKTVGKKTTEDLVEEKEESELLAHDGNRGHQKQMSEKFDNTEFENNNTDRKRVSQHRLSNNLTLLSAYGTQRDRVNRELLRLSFLSAKATNNKNAAKYEKLQKQFKAKFMTSPPLEQHEEEEPTPPPPSDDPASEMEKALTPPPPAMATAEDSLASDEKESSQQITMKVTEAHRDMYQRNERIVRVADLVFPDRSHERLDKILAHSRISNLGGGGTHSARVSSEHTPLGSDGQLQLPMYGSSVRMDPLDPASYDNLDFAKSMSTQRWRQHKRSLTPNLSTSQQPTGLFVVAEPSRNMSRSAMTLRVKRQEKEYEAAVATSTATPEQKKDFDALVENAEENGANAEDEATPNDADVAGAEYHENNGLKLRDFKSDDGKITYTEIEVGVLSSGNFFGETTLINEEEEEEAKDEDELVNVPSTVPEHDATDFEPPPPIPKQTSILDLLQASSQSQRHISHISKDSTATMPESAEIDVPTSNSLSSSKSLSPPLQHTFIDSAKKRKKSRKKVTAEQQTMSYHASRTTFRCLTSCVIYSITKENLDEFFRRVPSARRRFDVMLSKYNVDLDTVLHIPRAARFFTLFLESELASENIHYVLSVNEFKEAYHETSESTQLEMARIISTHFIDEDGKQPINVSGTQRKLILDAIQEEQVDVYIFDVTQKAIYLLLERDCFPRFKQSHFFREFLNEEENLAFLTKEQYEQQQKEEERQELVLAESNLLQKVKSLKSVSAAENDDE